MSDVVALDDVTVSALFENIVTPLLKKRKMKEKKKIEARVVFSRCCPCRSTPLDGETQAAVRRVSRVFAKQLVVV